MKHPLILPGQEFGHLIVLQLASRDRHRNALWDCICNCGQRTVVSQTCFRREPPQRSCGCLRVEIGSRSKTHGLSKSAEHGVWSGMKKRVLNPQHEHFAYYGGRGITVCDRWRDSFANFYADMGPRPSPKHSIERRDNDAPYAPENCYWATREEQMNNKRSNHRITYQGETLTLAKWARGKGIRYKTLWRRIVKLKWPLERAFIP